MKKQKDGLENFPRSVLGKAFYRSETSSTYLMKKGRFLYFFLNFSRDHHLSREGSRHELQDKEELLHDAHPHRPGQSSLLLHRPGPQLKLNFWDPRDSV